MKSVCVFLGSSHGNNHLYKKVTRELGKNIALKRLTCVYGGSCTGLMNELAESVLENNGNIIGVTVQALKDKEGFHKNLSELHVVPTMHERKNLMVDLSDAFIALPGGIGTFEEFFEVYTLKQMGFHSKPCAILDVNEFYKPLKNLMVNTEKEGFLKNDFRKSIIWSKTPSDLIDTLINL